MKYLLLLSYAFFLNCCGYPDIDTVPDFKNVLLSDEEVKDYCSNTNSENKNIDKCINDYKSRN